MGIYSFKPADGKPASIDEFIDKRSDADRLASPLSIFNEDKPDLAMIERIVEESVNIGGAVIKLRLKKPYVAEVGVEEVWDEDPDPTYENPILMKAIVDVSKVSIELKKFGVDVPLTATVKFARAPLWKTVGDRLIKPGDIIELSYGDPINGGEYMQFRVMNAYSDQLWSYRWLYFTCKCENIIYDKSLRAD